MLIGDPKQAIYAFRGADVFAYLDAADAGRRPSPRSSVNWRSDGALIEAYDALFADCQLGHEGIAYRHGQAGCRPTRIAGCVGAPDATAAAVQDRSTAPTGSCRLTQQGLRVS